MSEGVIINSLQCTHLIQTNELSFCHFVRLVTVPPMGCRLHRISIKDRSPAQDKPIFALHGVVAFVPNLYPASRLQTPLNFSANYSSSDSRDDLFIFFLVI